MANRFARSSMIPKNIRFTLQIGNYSKYACKGYYVSPEFGSESKWSLIVSAYDGADYLNFIDVHLRKDDFSTEDERVNVNMSIINCLGFCVFKSERKIMFREEAQVLTVSKEDLNGYFGLKKFFYLPGDTLTLQCDLTVYENNVSANALNDVPDNGNKFSEYFAHSHLREEARDYFSRQINNFSVHIYGGRYFCPDYHSRHLGGRWNFNVYYTNDDYQGEIVDIRLRRREVTQPQLVKAKLSVIDASGNILSSSEKDVYFSDTREAQLLSLNQKNDSSLLSFFKKRSIPDDTLTLRCEMVLYKEIEDTFDRKENFDESITADGYTPVTLIPYLIIFSLVFCFMLFSVAYLSYLLYLTLVSFIWYCVSIVADIIRYSAYGVLIIAIYKCHVKYMEHIEEKRIKRAEMKRKIRQEVNQIMASSHYAQVVPFKKNQHYGYYNPNYGNYKYLTY